jgi:hypothetical protein
LLPAHWIKKIAEHAVTGDLYCQDRGKLLEIPMKSETIGKYEIEYSGFKLPEREDWVAILAIYASCNPVHRNGIFPPQRVALGCVFPNEQVAQAEAREIALSMIETGCKTS